jgi:hypothetical protein
MSGKIKRYESAVSSMHIPLALLDIHLSGLEEDVGTSSKWLIMYYSCV